MIDDEKPKKNEEESDFDLEPELDDFDDEWDDFDDDLDLEDDGDESAEDPAPNLPGKKTFLQKFFIPIVIIIIVIFGGLFLLGIGAFDAPSSSVQQPVDEYAENDESAIPPMPTAPEELVEDEGLPPMPAAMQDDMGEEGTPAPVAEEPPLTPLPNMDGGNTEEAELTNLDDALDDGNFDVRKAVPITDIQEEPLEEPPFEIDAGQNNLASSDETNTLPPTSEELPAPLASEPEPDVTETPETERASDIVANEALSKDLAALEQQKSELASENEALQDNINQAQDRLSALEEKLAAIEKSIADKEAQSETLTRDLANMEEKFSQTRQLQETAQEPAAEPKIIQTIQPKPVSKPVAPTPKPKAAPAVTTQPKAAAKSPKEWVLRAAQPGRASIAPKGSNDLRSVEIGETVDGLGRITSIQIESGLWVVRGTQGFVSQ